MEVTGLLTGYRAIEIGDPSAMFTGKLLGDLGCDVLRIEPPSGDPSRRCAPLVPWGYGQVVSATWLAYSTSKRSVALDIEHPRGRSILDDLLGTADLSIVSAPVIWIERHRLLPGEIRAKHPDHVAIAITPFGLAGPHRDYLATDLTLQAAGGMLFMNGDADRPPVRISEEMAWPQAGSQAAFASMAALFNARRTGVGEEIDLSVQEAIVSALVDVDAWWQFERRIPMRSARVRLGRDIQVRMVWPCKDGFVTFRLSFGQGLGNRNLGLVNWMAEEGMDDGLLAVPWEYLSTLEMSQEQVNEYQEKFERFFMTKTRAELYAGALERRIMLFPVSDLASILGDRQLQEREFFLNVQDEAARGARFPGPLFHALPSVDPIPKEAPGPGEHTREVLQELLNLGEAELDQLCGEGVLA